MDVSLRMLAAPALVMLLFGSGGQCALAAAEADSHKQQSAGPVAAEQEIASLLASLRKALLDGNAVGVSSLFTEDAIFIDESGQETHGRKGLLQGFEAQFKSRQSKPGVFNVEFEPEKVTFPAPNIALVVGSTSKQSGQERSAATRFSMFMEKSNGVWLINEATETRIKAETSAHEHLSDLDWLLGSWKIKHESGFTNVKVEWAPGGNFIRATSVSTEEGAPEPKTDAEIIGWDERTTSIVSWTFGWSGNFSYSKWKNDGNQWSVDIAGVTSDGSDVVSRVILSPKTADTFSWQSVSRVVAGNALPDTPKMMFERTFGNNK